MALRRSHYRAGLNCPITSWLINVCINYTSHTYNTSKWKLVFLWWVLLVAQCFGHSPSRPVPGGACVHVCLCAVVLGVFSEFQSYELKHTDMQYKNCLVHLDKCCFLILLWYSYFPFRIRDLPLWPRLASNGQSSLSPPNTDVTGVCRCAQCNQSLVWQGHVEFGGSYSLSRFCDTWYKVKSALY